MQVTQVVAGVLISPHHYGDVIILTRRAEQCNSYPNFFEFPGGKIKDQDISFKKALIKELKEGLSINILEEDVLDFPNNSFSINNEINLTLFIVKKWNGLITLKDNIHSEKKFVNIMRLKCVDNLLDSNKVFIDAIVDYFGYQTEISDIIDVQLECCICSNFIDLSIGDIFHYCNCQDKNNIGCNECWQELEVIPCELCANTKQNSEPTQNINYVTLHKWFQPKQK